MSLILNENFYAKRPNSFLIKIGYKSVIGALTFPYQDTFSEIKVPDNGVITVYFFYLFFVLKICENGYQVFPLFGFTNFLTYRECG